MSAWARRGECNHCGHCCTAIAREALVRDPREITDRAFYDARGFQTVLVDGRAHLVLYAWLYAPCPQHVDNQCAIHDRKPETCAAFPRLPQDIVDSPCSYWFERDGMKVGGAGSPYQVTAAQLQAIELQEVPV